MKHALKPYIIGGIATVFVGIVAFVAGTQVGGGEDYLLGDVEQRDLTESVFVSGSVEPTDEVELGFSRSGRVAGVNVSVGEEVARGTLLASLDSASIRADLFEASSSVEAALSNLEQARANLLQEEIELEKLLSGGRDEDVRIADIDVQAAQDRLEDARNDLLTVRAEAEVDLETDYASAVSEMVEAVDAAKSALLAYTDIQYDHFSGTNGSSQIVRQNKTAAMSSLFSLSNAGGYNAVSVAQQSGGLYGQVRALIGAENVDPSDLLRETIFAVEDVFLALDGMPLEAALSDADLTTIDTEKSTLSSTLTSLRSAQTAIQTQLADNATAIANAEQAIVDAENAFARSQEQRNLVQTGSRDEDVRVQETHVSAARAVVRNREASVNQARARLAARSADLSEARIVAPFDGVVTRVELTVGEVVSSNTAVITLITDGGNLIETFVPELNIGKVSLDDEVEIDFEAFPGKTYMGRVGLIDPAETIDDGLPSYKVTIYFEDEENTILPGMTGDTRIITERRDQSIAVPADAIVNEMGTSGVYVLVDEQKRFISVRTGIVSDDGFIEILEGVTVGDVLILNP